MTSPRFVLPFLVLAGHLAAPQALAESAPVNPVRLEKILTGKGVIRVDSTLTYAPGYLNTAGAGSSAQIPPLASEVQGLDINSAALALTMSYGLGNGTEISVGSSQNWQRTTTTVTPFDTNSDSRWNGLSVGVSHQLYHSQEDKLVLIAAASIDLTRQLDLGDRSRRVSGRSGAVSLTLNKVVDPLVLSLAANFAKGVSGNFGGQVVKEPSVFSLTPSVSFQINERIGLGWGAQFSRIGKQLASVGELGAVEIGAQSQTAFLFSVNYQTGRNSAWTGTYSFPTLQSAAPVFSLRYLADFD